MKPTMLLDNIGHRYYLLIAILSAEIGSSKQSLAPQGHTSLPETSYAYQNI